jgi:DNA polymerase-1
VLKVVDSLDDAFELKRWFSENNVIACDTETTGVDVYSRDFHFRLIQFGNEDAAWVIPFERWKGLADELITQYTGELLIHNSAFDIEALAAEGITVPWHQVTDTMIAMRLAEPHLPSGLKDSSVRHVSSAASGGQIDLARAMRKNKWTWATIPIDFPLYTYYAAMDVILGSRLRNTDVCKKGIASPVYEMEMDVRQIATDMQRGGMRVNVEFCRAQEERLRAEVELYLEHAQDVLGINLMSNDELGKWLLANGGKLTKATPGGKPSVAVDALKEARTVTTDATALQVIDDVLKVRKYIKLASTYFANFVGLADMDGFLHPSIETIAARTGRASIRQPALQTLPRAEDPDALLVRKAVIPREEGHVLIACDYNQIELRLMASFSADQELVEAFRISDETGNDFFTEATRNIYGDPSIVKADVRRGAVKMLFYASSYGAGITKLAAASGIAYSDMEEISGRVFGKYPGIKRLMRQCENIVKKNDGWITTPAGRSIWVDPDQGYKAMNAFIQGQAADIFKRATVDLAHAGLAEFMVVPVHDEMLFSIPEELVADAIPVIRETMTDTSLAVPLLAEPSDSAPTWGDIAK